MKAPAISLLLLVGGFAAGYFATRPSEPAPAVEASTSPRKSNAEPRDWSPTKLAPATRMQGLAEKAASLNAADWPAFFLAQLDSPDASRLAARLWAESDPEGFWSWLKEGKDSLMLDRFGDDLMKTWAAKHPDEALAAACEVTDSELGGKLRRAVVDSTLDRDLQKGIELAARAGSIGGFSWGPREWMKKDPAAAVKGLATLPAISEFRHFLTYAVPVWVESDPSSALAWLKDQRPTKGDRWTQDSFKAAAKADTAAALEIARSFPGSKHREEALAGVLSGWRRDVAEAKEVIAELPLGSRGSMAMNVFFSRPSSTVADLEQSTRLLEVFPASRDTLSVVESLAHSWRMADRAAGLKWANSLADPVARERALKVLQPNP